MSTNPTYLCYDCARIGADDVMDWGPVTRWEIKAPVACEGCGVLSEAPSYIPVNVVKTELGPTHMTEKEIESFFNKVKADFSRSNMAHKEDLEEVEAMKRYVYLLRAKISSKEGFVRQAMGSMKAALR